MTRSGCSRATAWRPLAASLASAQTIGFAVDEFHQSLAEHGVIVDEHDAEFLLGERCCHGSPARQDAGPAKLRGRWTRITVVPARSTGE